MKTDITVILDRSGSMASCVTDTIGGFNTFLTEQRKQTGECVLSLVHFDSEYNAKDMPSYTALTLSEAKELTPDTYIPRGSTALRDALGRTINAIGDRLRALPEHERPGKVIVNVITDGYENCSREFSPTQIKEMIERQRNTYNWEFNFIGANQDAVIVGQTYGFAAMDSLSFDTAHGTKAMYSALTQKVSASRSGVARGFTEAERTSAMTGVDASVRGSTQK